MSGKLTLLEAVQDILSALDFDPVTDIDETIESAQVAQELKTTYFTMMGPRDWPHLKVLSTFDGLADQNNKCKMQMKEDFSKVYWVKYNDNDVTYMPPKEFQDLIDSRKELDNADDNGYLMDKDPEYWTTFDDKYVYMDSIDDDAEDTLHSSRCKVFGVKVPTWTHTNSFTPDMPQKMFYTWLAEAKSACFINLKQTANAKEETRAKRGMVAMQSESWRNEQGEVRFNRRVNYGR